MTKAIQQILKKLDAIESDIVFIKEHMVDIDTILTPEEEVILEKGLREYKQGKTITLEDYKKKRR